MGMKTLIVILGPTGVGKTETCLEIAERLNTSVINADSRQVFAEIPVGTAAPTAQQMARVRHHLAGHLCLEDYYSASLFENDVMGILEREFVTHDFVVMSGGSMMYIDAVCNGIDDIPTVDDATRSMMKRRYEEEGLDALLDELKRLDPEHYEVVDRKNPKRVVHALEICHMTGRTYTSFRRGEKKQRPFRIVRIGLTRERPEMYDRINRRVLQMMEDGLEAEARSVYAKRSLNSLNTVGFKELFSYFDGKIPLEEAVRQIQSNTRRYYRKQMTWFKRDKETAWFHPDDREGIMRHILDKTIENE